MKVENYLTRKLREVYWAGFREHSRRVETDDDLPEDVLIECRKLSIDDNVKEIIKWLERHKHV